MFSKLSHLYEKENERQTSSTHVQLGLVKRKNNAGAEKHFDDKSKVSDNNEKTKNAKKTPTPKTTKTFSANSTNLESKLLKIMEENDDNHPKIIFVVGDSKDSSKKTSSKPTPQGRGKDVATNKPNPTPNISNKLGQSTSSGKQEQTQSDKNLKAKPKARTISKQEPRASQTTVIQQSNQQNTNNKNLVESKVILKSPPSKQSKSLDTNAQFGSTIGTVIHQSIPPHMKPQGNSGESNQIKLKPTKLEPSPSMLQGPPKILKPEKPRSQRNESTQKISSKSNVPTVEDLNIPDLIIFDDVPNNFLEDPKINLAEDSTKPLIPIKLPYPDPEDYITLVFVPGANSRRKPYSISAPRYVQTTARNSTSQEQKSQTSSTLAQSQPGPSAKPASSEGPKSDKQETPNKDDKEIWLIDFTEDGDQ